VYSLAIYYGQKNQRELASRDQIVQYYKNMKHDVRPLILSLSDIFIANGTIRSPLLIGGEPTPQVEGDDLEGKGALVPFRNGILIAAATVIAQNFDCGEVWIGLTGEGARDYPDCSKDFVDATRLAVRSGTAGAVQLVAPFADMTKRQVVECAIKEEIPIDITWSCYSDGTDPCNKCQACVERRLALSEDPSH
jgi:7-cyano-7-deazaguanine synthase